MALDISSVSSTILHAVTPETPGVATPTASAKAVAAQARAAAVQAAHDTATGQGAGKPELPKPEPVIPSDLQQTLAELEQVSAAFNRHLSFSVNQKLDSIVVKVVDSETDKVIREIPPAELQHVYEAIRETIGLLFDDQA